MKALIATETETLATRIRGLDGILGEFQADPALRIPRITSRAKSVLCGLEAELARLEQEEAIHDSN
jgi:hypothetical protein